MSLKSKLQKVVDKATLKLVDAVNPEMDEDSFLDLKIEQIEGREHVERPVVPIEENKPIYRADGQVHNFAAAPWPGKRRITIAQYNARYGNARPEPKHSVAGLVDIKENPPVEPATDGSRISPVVTKPDEKHEFDPRRDSGSTGELIADDDYIDAGRGCGDDWCQYCGDYEDD